MRTDGSSVLFLKASLHRLEGFPKGQSSGKAAQFEPPRLSYPGQIYSVRVQLQDWLKFQDQFEFILRGQSFLTTITASTFLLPSLNLRQTETRLSLISQLNADILCMYLFFEGQFDCQAAVQGDPSALRLHNCHC